MTKIPAYFDGNTVRTLSTYPFVKNQQFYIVVDDNDNEEKNDAARRLSLQDGLQKYRGRLTSDTDEDEAGNPHKQPGLKALRGSLSNYANPELIPTEKDAWAQAAGEKHGIR